MFFNFVSTLDGRAALDGSTRPLGGPADLEMLLSLRAVADAVLIGPGTVRAEGYGRLVGPQRRADVPPAVLISRRFDIPWEAGLFAGRGPAGDRLRRRPTRRSRPTWPRPVEVVRLDECTPGAALADLRSRGIRALLSEGGPTLFHGFLEAGFVDELFFTLTPMITGDEAETAIVSGARLAGPRADDPAMGLARRGGTVPPLRDGPLASLRWSGGWRCWWCWCCARRLRRRPRT